MSTPTIRKGQEWEQGATGKRGTTRRVRVAYVWTSSPNVDVVPVDDTDGRKATLRHETLWKSYRLVKDAP